MKIGFAYRDWANIIHGTPPGSILRRLLYNIFVNDVFLVSEKPNICDFADNNTIFPWQQFENNYYDIYLDEDPS